MTLTRDDTDLSTLSHAAHIYVQQKDSHGTNFIFVQELPQIK